MKNFDGGTFVRCTSNEESSFFGNAAEYGLRILSFDLSEDAMRWDKKGQKEE